PAAELAAEGQLRRHTAQVEVPGQVDLDVLLGIGGVLLFPFHFGQAEVVGVMQVAAAAQPRFAGAVEADIAEIIIAFEGGIADTTGAGFTCLTVTGLGADAPFTQLTFAAEDKALYLLGLLAGLELAGDFGIAQLTGQLRIGES